VRGVRLWGMATGAGPRTSSAGKVEISAEDELAIQEAWAAVVPEADRIADEITRMLLAKDRGFYESIPAEIAADIRAGTRENIRRGLRNMSGQPQPEGRAVDLWRDTGRRRARQGIPLELVLSAYSLGVRVLWEALLERQRSQRLEVDERVLILAGHAVWSALDVQNAIIVEAYRSESLRMQRLDLRRRLSVLDRLAEGRGSDPAFAEEARQVLDLGSHDRVACVVAILGATAESPLRMPEDGLERIDVTSHWHIRGGHHFGLLVLGEHDVADVVRVLRPMTSGRVGIMASRTGLAGFATAFQLAARAAATLPEEGSGVVPAADRLPELLLARSREVTEFLVAEALGQILAQPDQHQRMLLDTLAAYLRHDLSPTHAAAELTCHRNTVIYRVRQLRALTRLDPHRPRDRMLLTLALIAIGRPPEGGPVAPAVTS